MAAQKPTWLDRTIGLLSPQRQLARTRARLATEQLLQLRHYEGAAVGRRTQGWNRSGGDANAVHSGATLGYLRNAARDLARNDRLIRQALRTIANHTVGWGVVPKPMPANPRALELWKQWAETTACDANGRNNIYGLQKLLMRSTARDGEVLVRRRTRRVEDGLPIPLQLQVLEADFLDTSKTIALATGNRVVQGVEFDALGRRVAYWLFPEHPGSTSTISTSTLLGTSRRVPASEILHLGESTDRAGQVRYATWLASLLLPAKDLNEYEDAQLMKQKIAACLAVLTYDEDGLGTPLGTADDTQTPATDTLQPGAILNVTPGRKIEVVQPPSVTEYSAYVSSHDRKSAKGLGLSYEDYTGDYSNVNFSSARMARIEHYENVYDWRWNLLVPQFCDPVWNWAMEAAFLGESSYPRAQWTAPPMPMIEPDKEGLAYQRNIRIGAITWPEMVRERGNDPDEVLEEIKVWNEKFDAAGVVLDSDPRKITAQGQQQTGNAASSAEGGGA
jgi:lambda family phage portal protein